MRAFYAHTARVKPKQEGKLLLFGFDQDATDQKVKVLFPLEIFAALRTLVQNKSSENNDF